MPRTSRDGTFLVPTFPLPLRLTPGQLKEQLNEQEDDDDDYDEDDDELLDQEDEGEEDYGIPVSLQRRSSLKSSYR